MYLCLFFNVQMLPIQIIMLAHYGTDATDWSVLTDY